MHPRFGLLNAAFAAVILSAGSAGPAGAAQSPPMATIAAQAPAERGDRASDRDMRVVRRKLDAMIEELQHDTRDYSGHRAAAIKQLLQARSEIDEALRTAGTH